MKSIFLESHNLKNLYTGFGQFNYHLIHALVNHNQDDFQFIINAKNPERWKPEFGAKVTYHKYRSLSRHKPFRNRKKYDLWHCLNQNIKIEPFHRIPYLLTVHDVHFITEGSAEDQKKARALFKQKLERATAITYISNFAKKDTHHHFEVAEVPEFVIHNGNTITHDQIPSGYEPDVLPKKPYLFSIGDFSPRKNFLTLINMLVHLPDHNLVLAGTENSDYAVEMKKRIQELGLQDRVQFLGKVPTVPKQYYLKNCEAFVFPSLREGFGIPPIEAMQFGKPVFISNNTSLPEVGGEHAFYWDHYDPEYMAKVFLEGMQNYQNNTEFYSNWYKDRAASFSWEVAAKKYMEVYRSILD